MLALALIENIQREKLNPIEIAHAYKKLIDECNLSQEEVSEKVGYQDSRHFTKLFQKIFGVTPRDYRRSVRSKLFSVDAIPTKKALGK